MGFVNEPAEIDDSEILEHLGLACFPLDWSLRDPGPKQSSGPGDLSRQGSAKTKSQDQIQKWQRNKEG